MMMMKKMRCFRKYDFVEDSYLDHSLFLVNERYSSLFELKNDYKNWAKGLKKREAMQQIQIMQIN